MQQKEETRNFHSVWSALKAFLDIDSHNRMHALLCAAVFLFSALVAKPYVEMGVLDDFSYIRSAQILAQTGHIAYNGWATAILGWQLYLGALFIHLFGFSFTCSRASIIVLSILTTYLLHRVMTGFGLSGWNANLGTLTIVLSPVWLLMEVTFMSDAPGFFCLVLCLYACQKAVAARKDWLALSWIFFAGLTNIVAGTVRQTAWLGVLVVVPSTVWLLRRRRGMLPTGAVLWLVGVVSIAGCLHWFKLQPYSDPSDTVHLLRGQLDRAWLKATGLMLLKILLSLLLFITPVGVLFVSTIKDLNRKNRTLFLSVVAGVITAVVIYAAAMVSHHKLVSDWVLPPWLGTNVTPAGVMQTMEIVGQPPVFLHERLRLVIFIATLVPALCILTHAVLRAKTPGRPKEQIAYGLSWRQTSYLLVPFALAYIVVLLPRASIGFIFDRYLIPLIMVFIIFLLRYVQEQLTRPSYWLSGMVLLLFSSFAVAGTHDLFTFDRARLQAIDEVIESGVQPTAVDGGFEYNLMTQILTTGYLPRPEQVAGPGFKLDPCRSTWYIVAPAVKPEYILSFTRQGCYPESKYADVSYHAWLPPHQRKVYMERVH